ncbi:MAG: formate dehydrogenase accessory sulfurtransferase FdhD [Dehalococcoidales bacterium]
MNNVEGFPIQRVTKEGKQDSEDVVTIELPLTIIVNNKELTTLLCSPTDLKYLAIGFLASEGLIKGKAEIKKIIVDEKRGVARVEAVEDKELAPHVFKRLITSGCGRGVSFHSAADVQEQSKVESQTTISNVEVFTLVREFQHRSQVFKTTGGVHSAALCDTKNILVFNEDIGRHNAIDKIFGECMLTDIPTDDRIIITSGRVSSEILLKVAKRNIPILISKSAPTNLGVRLAHDLGVTLIGFVRGERMNVYASGWRVTTNGK